MNHRREGARSIPLKRKPLLSEKQLDQLELECASLIEYVRNGYPKRTRHRITRLRRWFDLLEGELACREDKRLAQEEQQGRRQS